MKAIAIGIGCFAVVIGLALGVVWWTLDRDTPGEHPYGKLVTDQRLLDAQNEALDRLEEKLSADAIADSGQVASVHSSCLQTSGGATYGPWLSVRWTDAKRDDIDALLARHGLSTDPRVARTFELMAIEVTSFEPQDSRRGPFDVVISFRNLSCRMVKD